MKDKKKKPARVGKRSSRNPRNPRKGVKTAADRVVKARQVIEGEDGRWREVERVVDTVGLLYRRRQIDERQYQAAGHYRDAVDACRGGIRSSLGGADTVRHRHKPGGPTDHQLWGAEVLADAARVLGLTDGRLVYDIVAEGHTIDEVAGRVFGRGAGGKPRELDAKHVGRRLREALTALADAWWPVRPQRIRGTGAPAEAGAAQPGEVERARVVHATARKIYESGG